MRSQAHTALVRRILLYLNKLAGCRAIPLIQSEQQAGEPDILCVYEGQSHFFEVKTGSGEATLNQQYKMLLWYEAGAIVYVVRDLLDVKLHLTKGGLYGRQQRESQKTESQKTESKKARA